MKSPQKSIPILPAPLKATPTVAPQARHQRPTWEVGPYTRLQQSLPMYMRPAMALHATHQRSIPVVGPYTKILHGSGPYTRIVKDGEKSTNDTLSVHKGYLNPVWASHPPRQQLHGGQGYWTTKRQPYNGYQQEWKHFDQAFYMHSSYGTFHPMVSKDHYANISKNASQNYRDWKQPSETKSNPEQLSTSKEAQQQVGKSQEPKPKKIENNTESLSTFLKEVKEKEGTRSEKPQEPKRENSKIQKANVGVAEGVESPERSVENISADGPAIKEVTRTDQTSTISTEANREQNLLVPGKRKCPVDDECILKANQASKRFEEFTNKNDNSATTEDKRGPPSVDDSSLEIEEEVEKEGKLAILFRKYKSTRGLHKTKKHSDDSRRHKSEKSTKLTGDDDPAKSIDDEIKKISNKITPQRASKRVRNKSQRLMEKAASPAPKRRKKVLEKTDSHSIWI